MTSLTMEVTKSIIADEYVCSTETAQTPFQIFFAVVFGTLIFCNTVLVIAAVMSWQVLRQYIVYRYLISCLLSAICFCVVSLYEMFHTLSHYNDQYVDGGVLQRYNSSDYSHYSLMRRDAYLKGILPALFIVMEFNIAALIYAVSDNTFFVGRYANPKLSSPSTGGKTDIPVHRRRMVRWKKYKAMLLIPLAWLVPIFISIPVGFGWNCIEYCLCLPMYRDNASTCVAPEGSSATCSRIWLPLTHSYITVMTVLYCVAAAVTFVMLILTVRAFYKTHAHRKPSTTLLTSCTPTKTKSVCIKTGSESTISTIYKRERPPLDDTVKLLIVTTLSLFVSVTPMLLLLFIDPYVEPAPTASQFSITMAFTFFYAACLPFILLKYMSGLRKACVNILMKCPCLRTYVVTVKSKRFKTNNSRKPKEKSMEYEKVERKKISTKKGPSADIKVDVIQNAEGTSLGNIISE